MTLFETITGLTLLMIGLLASVNFYQQIDCYHGLTVKAFELRVRPLEHDQFTTFSYARQCSGKLIRNGNNVLILSPKTKYQISIPVSGKL